MLLALAGHAFAQDACLLVLKVQPKDSQYEMGGTLTKPVKGEIPSLKATAGGNVYLRLPPVDKCPPKFESVDQLYAALAESALAQPAGKPAVTFAPSLLHSAVINDATKKSIANWTLSGTSFGLHGNALLGKGIRDAKTGAKGCVETIFTGGTLHLDSVITGPRQASLASVAQNHTMAAFAEVSSKGGRPAGVTLTVRNATFVFDISRANTPGVMMTSALYQAKGDLVAAADLADPKAFLAVSADKVDWNAMPRLWQPTVMGGEEKDPEPAYVPDAGAPGNCQVAAAGAAASPSSSSAAAPAGDTKQGSGAGAARRAAAAALFGAAVAGALLV